MKPLLINLLSLIVLVSCGEQVAISHQPQAGQDGQNCYGESISGGVNVICGDETYFISNGQDGANGQNGINGTNGVDGQDGQDGTFQGYLEYRTICPSISSNSSYKETLLYLDGQYLAFLSNGSYKKQRLAVLTENTLYVTTDGRNVNFTIVNGEIQCL